MSHDFAALRSQVSFPGPCGEDFGVREERYRMNIGKKIRSVVREMDKASFREPVGNHAKYRDILSKIRRRMEGSLM